MILYPVKIMLPLLPLLLLLMIIMIMRITINMVMKAMYVIINLRNLLMIIGSDCNKPKGTSPRSKCRCKEQSQAKTH